MNGQGEKKMKRSVVLCKKCPKRIECSTLCPEAENYVNQDYVQMKPRTYRFSNMENFVLQPHGTYKLIVQRRDKHPE